MLLRYQLALAAVSLFSAGAVTTTALVSPKYHAGKLMVVSTTSLFTCRLQAAKNDDDSAADRGGLSYSPGEATQRLGSNPGPTVWTEFARIAQEYNPVNLGQGFPDWLPPKFAVDSLVEAVLDSAQSPHQYTRPAGHPSLVNQLARRYSTHLKREINANDEVAVTVGASQALYLSLQTLIRPGDEVILFEPFFDLYVNQVRLAGGTPVFVPLQFVPYNETDGTIAGGDWKLDRDVLLKVVSPTTKAIILNSPHNPTGKIFTRNEMEIIAESLDLAGPNCVVLSDEVYKYIVHAPPQDEFLGDSPLCPGHTHFASLPGMWDKTITISSAGKTFSATGWQVGWYVPTCSVQVQGCISIFEPLILLFSTPCRCIGPKRLISPIHQLLPYVQFCASTVIQEALARSLPRADEPYEGHTSYYSYLKSKYTRKRDLLVSALSEAGFAVPDFDKTPGGGFFIFARAGKEITDLIPQKYLFAKNRAAPGGVARQDWALCQWMAEEIGLLCIPSSPFFSPERGEEGASDSFIRVAFCKSDETIEAAASALSRLKSLNAVAGESSNITVATVN
jgi:kynurenine--oxoglutarate transaminase/cysteine-S-conjugate beta-lyase/glutamine--phenylpyruvate transaminase